METDIADTGFGQQSVKYSVSASSRYRGQRYLGVRSARSYSYEAIAENFDYPEFWETEFRLRYQLGQLKLDSRLRYASHIFGTNYSEQGYQGGAVNSRANDLSYKLEYAPNVGTLLRIDQAFDFEKQILEFGKISSFISLFGDVPWVSLTASNTINPQTDNWGNILLEARLQEGAFAAAIRHTQDLEAEPLRADPTILFNETQSALELRYQLNQQFSLLARTAYNYLPLKPVANNQPRYWEALDFSVRFYEDTNSAQFSYSHDLNEGQPRFYNFETQFQVEDIRIAINQSFWPNSVLKHSNSWRFTLKDVAGIEIANYPFLSLTQYFDDGVYDRTERIKIFDDLSYLNFEAEYSRSFDSRLERNDTIGNYRNSALNIRLSTNRLYLEDKAYWLKARSNLSYSLVDALQNESYLKSFSLGISGALSEQFAVATDLSYRASYVGEKVDQHLYRLEQLTFTTKANENTYASASFNNLWNYSSNAVNPVSWSPYPTFYMIYEPDGLDFYAFVESETGAIGIGLGFSDLLGFQLQDGRSLVLP